MTFFTIITGAVALVHSGGVYRQADLYARGSAVYAKHGAGFIRLSIGGATSAPKIRWAEIQPGETAIINDTDGKAPVYEGEREGVALEAAE
ncbi:hypothetical protein [uncultured Mameliella sp.]|uniref:hypothetical protein n=1 Tax=uncultured Mameliella sp. TaxID=1447087 RepID=UPI00261F13DB|nr:hypothetical protein [uncultured Mameliella sp.]